MAEEISREKISGWFEIGAKIVTLSIALTYFIGFLVVAWHLSKYGVSSISLLHLQYLVAGLWVVLPPGFVSFLMLTKNLPVLHLERRWGKLSWVVTFIVELLTSFPANMVLSFFVGFLVLNLSGRKVITMIFLLLFTGLAISFCISSVRMSPEKRGRLIARDLASFYGGFALVAMAVYIWFFAVNIYPAIPFSWGGGKPLDVIFLEGDKPLPDGIVKDGSARHSIAYKLLAVTEKAYVVLPQTAKQKSVQFDRESVQGIVVLN